MARTGTRFPPFLLHPFPILALWLALSGGAAVAHASDPEDAVAEAVDARCSVASLEGTYAFTFSGTVFRPDGTPAASLEGVGLEAFDGHGRTVDGHNVGLANGQAFDRTFSGTYVVNPDCTGTKSITFDNGEQGHFFFVLADDRRQVLMTQTDPGQAVSVHVVRQ